MRRNGTIWMLAAVLACAAVPARAQPVSEARIQELIKQAALQVSRGNMPDSQAQSQAPGQTRPVVRLTLDDAVKFALDRNLTIAVQRLNPEINDISVQKIRSIYLPSLNSTLSTQSTTTPANSTLAGGSAAGQAVIAGLTTYNGGVTQSVPWGGGSFNVALNNSKNTTSSLNTLYNPAYNTNWSGTYTQPLLRNLRTDSTRQQIQVTRVSRDISDVQLKSTIVNTLSNVREAYWNYVFAVQAVEVTQQSVDLAEQLVKDNQTRVEVGTMAPIDVITAQSQAATARQNLVVAQNTMRTSELALKTLIVSGTSDPNWDANLDPIDRPEFQPEPIDLEAAIRRALSERTDLEDRKSVV
jgi:outer membrane protein